MKCVVSSDTLAQAETSVTLAVVLNSPSLGNVARCRRIGGGIKSADSSCTSNNVCSYFRVLRKRQETARARYGPLNASFPQPKQPARLHCLHTSALLFPT